MHAAVYRLFSQGRHATDLRRAVWDSADLRERDWGRSQYGIGLGLIKANGPWGFLALPNALYGIFYYVALSLTQLPSTSGAPPLDML